MAKYSYELKKEVVKAYHNGDGGYGYIAQKYNISGKYIVEQWVKAYNEFGEKGLMHSRKKENYSFDFKLHVVELYLTTEVSYQELALSVGMNNPSLIKKWVNDYRVVGPDALRPKRKGRRKDVNKQTKEINNDISGKTDIDTEYLKQLKEENLKLRIENAYLKELRRLRLLEEKQQNKKRESSTVSEDHLS